MRKIVTLYKQYDTIANQTRTKIETRETRREEAMPFRLCIKRRLKRSKSIKSQSSYTQLVGRAPKSIGKWLPSQRNQLFLIALQGLEYPHTLPGSRSSRASQATQRDR